MVKFSASIGVLALLAVVPALAQLPHRDLTVELRQVAEGDGYSVSTQSSDALMDLQSIKVRNGEKASLSLSKSIPMQWTSSVTAQSTSLAASGAAAGNTESGVKNAIVWMDASQSIKVQPRWPGGNQPAIVEIEVQSASVKPRTGTELPDQSRSQLTTTVSAPLGKWVNIGSSGNTPKAGVYSSQATVNNRRVLQIRVSDGGQSN